MEGYNTQFDSVEKLLNSDKADCLPKKLRTFFLTAKNYTSLPAVEQAIEAYQKVSSLKTATKGTTQEQEHESITALLESDNAITYIPDNIYKVLITGKSYATPEIIESLIHTFETIEGKNL